MRDRDQHHMITCRRTAISDATLSTVASEVAVLLFAGVSGSHEFLEKLQGYLQQSFPAITLKKGSRLNVSGETLETCDLDTLLGSKWLNDKVCIYSGTSH